MPELPEVETVRRGLAPTMEEARLVRLETRRPDLRFPLPERFEERVGGRRIVGLGRRAKYLLIDLDDGMTIIAHLGMSGSFRIEAAEPALAPGVFHHPRSKDEKHDHVLFDLERRDGLPVRVIYNDPRRFGFMHLWSRSELDLYPAFAGLGPEPTGNLLDAGYLAGRFLNRIQPLKGMLLDQSVIAGLGNIYVCEALWRSGLSPKRAAGTLVTRTGKPRAALPVLTQAIREVIADAIAAGGSSLRDHIQTDGSLGYFQHRFAVYDREGEACVRAGCAGRITRIVQSGRSTFFCPACQR
ncbi:bifunctional DNA-formamidopyrimidine glycosylase/DNA-(apurinic or apyrimidinic site) lyase [Rhizobium sp. SSA_523]|uniref:bifunctional DNA-formamidopyrimidine glycosylase/DNA-(apurinic or apyrimidinic site) lyase n=1 Tax=Rhizobium sp. SSA_523 TaxID=2952477 RepID=UPI002091D3B3|nr:bifunctional DNA-formamidopyrimidine glycosylase/DNA-(apurinic or apyrimidinic site) lyase [Rhizobium sp. SSA_523]MCO5732672.1 bifunctional DNA-formamidopyrimidine glycosylase/DNA-(apurinic or apyrimidinic site) lyase [Rhizobium sp. SSA_523]WKC23700.1 bifunctional DNA-formamidopyrimidine glycosylase/DNA-(apurinic or apyrimidinic site) lyase [Rhizobium sp. SSA_523]